MHETLFLFLLVAAIAVELVVLPVVRALRTPRPPAVLCDAATSLPGGIEGRPRLARPRALALMVLVPLCTCLLPACAAFYRQPVALQKAEADALRCGIAGVQQEMQAIAPDVLNALAGDSPDWRQQLEARSITAGVNVLGCAVAHALYDALGSDVQAVATTRDLEQLQHAVTYRLAMAGNGAVLPTPTQRVLARGLEYLRAHVVATNRGK
jgi:hypothetical protein